MVDCARSACCWNSCVRLSPDSTWADPSGLTKALTVRSVGENLVVDFFPPVSSVLLGPLPPTKQSSWSCAEGGSLCNRQTAPTSQCPTLTRLQRTLSPPVPLPSHLLHTLNPIHQASCLRSAYLRPLHHSIHSRAVSLPVPCFMRLAWLMLSVCPS